MKSKLILFLLLAQSLQADAQNGNADLMPGHNYLHYQHSISKTLEAKHGLGWQHIATFIRYHAPAKEGSKSRDEIMNQLYLSMPLTKHISVRGGLFYTNVGGYTPSLAVQFAWVRKSGLLIVAPRADVTKDGAFELFLLGERFFPLTRQLQLFLRVQAMSSVGLERHNRSYQQFRAGVAWNGWQLGGGLTLDEYGTDHTVHRNAGIFLRRTW